MEEQMAFDDSLNVLSKVAYAGAWFGPALLYIGSELSSWSSAAPTLPTTIAPLKPLAAAASSATTPATSWYSLYKKTVAMIPSKTSVSIPGTRWRIGLVQDESGEGNRIVRLVGVALTCYVAYRATRSLFSSNSSKENSLQQAPQPQINIKIDIHNDHNGGSPQVQAIAAQER